jgi:centromere/kinetochore protein ZW10
MAATTESRQLSDAIVAFALDGQFPNDVSSLPPVSQTDLGPAIEALKQTKTGLEVGQHHPS